MKISGVLFLEQPLILPAPSLSQKCEPLTWKELRKLIYTPLIKGSIPNIVDIVLYCIVLYTVFLGMSKRNHK